MVILQNFFNILNLRLKHYHNNMKMRLLKAVLLLFTLLDSMYIFGQAQTFDGCLNHAQLYELYSGNVQSMGQMMGRQRFFMVSNDNNVSFVRQNDTLTLNLCNWQFSQGFNDIYVNAFYKEGFYNFLEYNTTSNCADKLRQECILKFKEEYQDSIATPSSVFLFRNGFQIIIPEDDKDKAQYFIQCYNPSDFEQLISLNKTQQEQELIARKIKEESILRNMAAADSLAELELFPEAISLLEEVYDLLPDYMGKVDDKLGSIKKQYKEKKIRTYTETGEKLYNEKKYADALEMFKLVKKEDFNNTLANERIDAINRKLDVLKKRGNTYEYSVYNPDNYLEFLTTLESELNHLIDNTPNGDLKMDFSILFDTLETNLSYFNIISFNTIAIDKNRTVLESRMSNLLGHKSLRPVYQEEIPVCSATDIKIDLSWDSKAQQIIKNRKKIVNNSSQEINPVIMDVLNNDMRMFCGTYDFLTKSKTINGQKYHDISLTKYKTVGGEAFVYGLFPGLGTLIATQGKEGAACMALSLVFYGGAIASYVLYKDYKKKYDETSATLNEKDAKNLNTKKEVCKWAAIGGVGIGGTIHFGGMIKALVRGVQNKKASKELRQALKNEPIEIQKEDIHIQ